MNNLISSSPGMIVCFHSFSILERISGAINEKDSQIHELQEKINQIKITKDERAKNAMTYKPVLRSSPYLEDLNFRSVKD